MRYVMHFSPTQFVERPAKQFFRGGVHASHQPLVVHGIKPLAHVRGDRFVRLQRASQCILRVPTFGDVLDGEENQVRMVARLTDPASIKAHQFVSDGFEVEFHFVIVDGVIVAQDFFQ
jgi:hypothetical protein